MSEEAELTWIIPLANFTSEIKKIELDEKTSIRKMNRLELRKTREHSHVYNAMQRESLLRATHVLEIEGKDALALAEKPVLALRLMKRGDVTYSVALRKDAVRRGIHAVSTGFGRLDFSTNIYSLDKKDEENLKAVWNSIRTIHSKPHLEFPTKEFMNTYNEKTPEDKLVSYLTIFESFVFVDRDKSIEPAGEVIGIAIGMLLGMSQQERERIKKDFIRAYKIRNARVHGNFKRLEKLKAEKDIKEIVKTVETYLRNTLRRFVEE